jgi:hypothetical protein
MLARSVPAKGGACSAGSTADHCAGLLTLSSSKLSATSTLPFAPIFRKWSAALVGHLWCRLGYRFCSSDRTVYEDANATPHRDPTTSPRPCFRRMRIQCFCDIYTLVLCVCWADSQFTLASLNSNHNF